MQTHGCPDFSHSKKEWPECLLLSTGCQDPLTSFIAYLNSFDLLRRRAQGTERALELQGMQLLTGPWAVLN